MEPFVGADHAISRSKNAFVGMGEAMTCSNKYYHFYGRFMASTASKNVLFRGGLCHELLLKMALISWGG